jgi:hypothetical protein
VQKVRPDEPHRRRAPRIGREQWTSAVQEVTTKAVHQVTDCPVSAGARFPGLSRPAEVSSALRSTEPVVSELRERRHEIRPDPAPQGHRGQDASRASAPTAGIFQNET